jgi:hypothetical protein
MRISESKREALRSIVQDWSTLTREQREVLHSILRSSVFTEEERSAILMLSRAIQTASGMAMQAETGDLDGFVESNQRLKDMAGILKRASLWPGLPRAAITLKELDANISTAFQWATKRRRHLEEGTVSKNFAVRVSLNVATLLGKLIEVMVEDM